MTNTYKDFESWWKEANLCPFDTPPYIVNSIKTVAMAAWSASEMYSKNRIKELETNEITKTK